MHCNNLNKVSPRRACWAQACHLHCYESPCGRLSCCFLMAEGLRFFPSFLTAPKRESLDSAALGWQQNGRRNNCNVQVRMAPSLFTVQFPFLRPRLHQIHIDFPCTCRSMCNHCVSCLWLQNSNYFLDKQPVHATAVERLLEEPTKRKRGATDMLFSNIAAHNVMRFMS